ncbi:MAG: MBL fold metallo-hydrolase [Proteobacteria bacterium]|nr:MBL fold metallo-hydrolase [Pseudomonadota bacterium]
MAVVVLVPPHRQVRRVQPALPSDAELRQLLQAENGPVSVRYFYTSTQKLEQGELAHTVFVARWADGRLFVIDLGMDRAAAAEFAELLQTVMQAEEAQFHGHAAELMSDTVGRVEGVGLTHLHIDHTQGVVPFCEARGPGATLYQTSFQAELHNLHTEESAALLAASCLEREVLDGGGVQAVSGFPGLGMVALGGHTPGSTLFALASGGRLWLFSGDITNTKADLLADRGKGFVYSYLLVPEDTERAGLLRRWLARLDAEEDMTVVVSHDRADVDGSGLAEYGPP